MGLFIILPRPVSKTDYLVGKMDHIHFVFYASSFSVASFPHTLVLFIESSFNVLFFASSRCQVTSRSNQPVAAETTSKMAAMLHFKPRLKQ